MLKNTIFALLSLLAFANSPAILASDNSPAPDLSTESSLVIPPVLAESPIPEEQAVQVHSKTQRPVNDNHKDYRYCLGLGSNAEIAACAYKNR